MNIIVSKEYLLITIHTVNPSITFLVFSRNICIIGLNFGFSICDNGYKTCQKVIIMATWNVKARTICTVGLLCTLEIPLWIIMKTCFRHKPLRNFTVICQLDRKYYIPQGLTFCKAIKTYLISFLRNALFKIDFILSACQTNFISPDNMLFIIEQIALIKIKVQ